MMGEHVEQPPPGFQITEGGDGRWTLRYFPSRIIGWRGLATHAWPLWASTASLLTTIGGVVFAPRGVVADIALALAGLGLIIVVFGLVYVLWLFSSVTAFTLGSGELVVLRSRVGYRRRREFRQGEVRSVAQVQEGESPLWSLEVTSGSRVKVLSWQTMDSTRWLGSRIAQWAGVPLKTLRREKPGPFKWAEWP
jgi:hypothetical protein